MNKILLLEDDISLIDGLQYALEKSGFVLRIARTVSEAGACLASERYDLLLLDVTLPDGTGFAICEQVRKKGIRCRLYFSRPLTRR